MIFFFKNDFFFQNEITFWIWNCRSNSRCIFWISIWIWYLNDWRLSSNIFLTSSIWNWAGVVVVLSNSVTIFSDIWCVLIWWLDQLWVWFWFCWVELLWYKDDDCSEELFSSNFVIVEFFVNIELVMEELVFELSDSNILFVLKFFIMVPFSDWFCSLIWLSILWLSLRVELSFNCPIFRWEGKFDENMDGVEGEE